MARLSTSGLESQRLATTAALSGESWSNTGAGVTIDTTTPRSGAACAACAASATNLLTFAVGGVLGRSYFFRSALRFSSVTPSTNLGLAQATSAAGTCYQTILTTAGEISVFGNIAAKTIVATGFKPAKDTWYVFEEKLNVPAAGNGKFQLIIRSDAGVVLYESAEIEANYGNSLVSGVAAGHLTSGETAVTVKVDDLAVNDDQGANEASYPGPGKVVMLKPVADKGRTGFTGGGGVTTNLWKAVDNTPPKGEASPGTDETQIGTANANETDFYEPTLAAYTTPVAEGGGGIKEGDTIKLVQALARSGNSTTTTRNVGISGISNPVLTETTRATGAVAAASDTATPPVGWGTGFTAVSYAPVVVLGTGPVLKVRRASATTNRINADQMGLLVEYKPSTAIEVPLQASSGVASATLDLKAATTVPLNASSGVASATAALQAPTTVPLGASSGTSSATLDVKAATTVPLNASSGAASATLGLAAPTTVSLGASSGQASASMALHAPTTVPLAASSGVATTSIAFGSFGAKVPLGASSGVATTSLSVHAGPSIALGPSSGVATTSIVIDYPILPSYSVKRGGVWIPL